MSTVFGPMNGIGRAAEVWASDPIPIDEAHLVDETTGVAGTAEALAETLRSPYDDVECLACGGVIGDFSYPHRHRSVQSRERSIRSVVGALR